MEGLVNCQYADHRRIARIIANLKKLGKDKIAVPVVEARWSHLNDLWNTIEERHRTLITDYRKESEQHEYIKTDVFSMMEGMVVRISGS